MRSLREQLARPFRALLPEAGDDLLQATRDPKFGDYQCNAPMVAAKKLGKNPRQLAQEWQGQLATQLADMAALEIAGPGFLNLRVTDDWLARQLDQFQSQSWEHDHPRQTVVVDYSSPNVAKEMHVGHIRSTILGDAIVRILDYAGHRVIRQNHLGDWGTQFGMLCCYLKENPQAAGESLSDIERIYREANQLFQSDPAFQDRARATVVALHEGDPSTLKLWEEVLELSRKHFQPLYQRLAVTLSRGDERGESFYRDRLEPVVEDLKRDFAERKNGMEVGVSDGALCVFLYNEKGDPEFLSPEGNPLPFLIRKSDGAFLYSSTDIAACRYRVEELGADYIIVLTEAAQALHFKMLIATVTRAGYLQGRVRFDHVPFGSILGSDRKRLKTRTGGTIKLAELLEEAVERAEKLVKDEARVPAEELPKVAEAVGIGSVKYADLSQNRTSDYVFSWEKMIALQGNTAAYLMYGYARSRNIQRKAGEHKPGPVVLGTPEERALGIAILRFPETLDLVTPDWRIHLLAEYLYELAGAFMVFNDRCRVLDAPDAAVRASRLRLCQLTSDVLKQGLSLLGIPVVEQM